MDSTPARPTVFISYSHADAKWLKSLNTMLAPVVRAGIASVWWDGKIKPSQIWRKEIEDAMASAKIGVLLVSPNFLASDFIQNEELPYLLDAAQQRGVTLLWCLLEPCLFEYSELQKIQATHDVARPLKKLRGADRQETLASICRTIASAAKSAAASPPAPKIEKKPGGETGPPIHNLPYPHLGDLFTGRQEELDALESGATAAITQSAAISGLGGIGKTRLAVEYAWRAGSRYTAVWFVRADSPEGLHRNLAALAAPDLLNLPEWEDQVEEKTIAAVKRRLREHPGWLMILDNVDTPEAQEPVLQILPALSNGRVLITSRLRNWPASVQKQSLEKLSGPEATQFLLHRTESGRGKAHDDEARAADLAGVLDGLPLALEQAAAYIVRHQMSFAEYLRAWEQERSEVLKWFDPRVMGYPASIAVTWKQTFDQLSPTAASLLRLMSFLAPEPIPMFLLEQGAEYIEEATVLFCKETGQEPESQTVRAAIGDLADYSLLSRQDGGAVTVHRMVQEALKDQIPQERTRAWIETALRIVDGAAVGEPWRIRSWPVWDGLRPHVAKIVAVADEVGISAPTSRLMNDLGVLLEGKILYSEAETWMRRALVIAEASFGKDHPDIVVYLHNLALLLETTNRLEEAEPLMRRALAIDEASFGNDHPNVARDLNYLAHLLQTMNRLKEAELLMRRALAIDEAIFGKKHTRIARDLNYLANLLRATNRLEEAEPLMRRALAISERSGNDNPEVARVLNNLAFLLHTTNRLEEAEPLKRRALTLGEASFGNNHPEVATYLNNLARLLQATNRLEEAESLMRRAVDIFEKSLGLDHPRTQTAQRNLEILLAAMGSSPSEEDSPP